MISCCICTDNEFEFHVGPATLARTGEGVLDLPSLTPGRATHAAARFLWLAPRVSPWRKWGADVIQRLVAFHALPWHSL